MKNQVLFKILGFMIYLGSNPLIELWHMTFRLGPSVEIITENDVGSILEIHVILTHSSRM